MTIKICETCGNKFDAKRESARFCGATCRKKASRVNVTNPVNETEKVPRVSVLEDIPLIGRHELIRVRGNIVPISSPECIYFLWLDDLIVYIGQSKQVITRVGSHVCEGKKTFNAISILVTKCNDINGLERAYIKKYAPMYNSNCLTETERLEQQVDYLQTEVAILKCNLEDNPDLLLIAKEIYPILYENRQNLSV